MGCGYRTCNDERWRGGEKEEDENCHGQANPFPIAGFGPEMQAYDVRDDALSYLSPWQVFQQIAHLEEEYHEDGEPKCEVGSYHWDIFVPDSVCGIGTKLEHGSENEDRKNWSSDADLSKGWGLWQFLLVPLQEVLNPTFANGEDRTYCREEARGCAFARTEVNPWK